MQNIDTPDYNKTLRLYDWTAVKDKLHKAKNYPMITEGQLWWCAVGENVGVEENGKSAKYSRPVLIIKKLNRDSFVGVPITSVFQKGNRFANFYYKGNLETAVLSQVRTFSVCRLYDRIGEVPTAIKESVLDALIRMLR